MKIKSLLLILSSVFYFFSLNAQNVGIGTTTPQAKLEIRDANSSEFRLGLSNNNWAKFQYSSSEGLRIESKNEGVEFKPFLLIGKELRFFSGAGTTPERMRLTQNGRLGIGTVNPEANLEVVGGIQTSGSLASLNLRNMEGANYLSFPIDQQFHIRSWDPNGSILRDRLTFDYNKTTARNRFEIVHTASPFDGLIIQDEATQGKFWNIRQWFDPDFANLMLYTEGGSHKGTFEHSTGAYFNTSDRNLKENIQNMSLILPSIMKLEPKSYTYKEDNNHRPQLGFIAQEVEKIFPQLVIAPLPGKEDQMNYTMNYSGFGVIAVKAIQEQQEIIENQNKRISTLESELTAIKNALKEAGITVSN
ncbi:MAG: tail fiber domain-containing protein [Saprospiraceae bacterium]